MKSKLRFTINLLSLFFSVSEKTNAQTPNWLWAKAIGGTGIGFGFAVAVDPSGSGDVYTTGWFNGTADFDPDSAGIFNLTSAGAQDVFISKLDGSGNFVWAKRMGGTIGGSVGFSIAVDPSGNGDIYTTGTFTGTADFDPDSSGIFNLTSNGFRDIFISKLDSSGNFIWAKGIGGPSDDYSRSIAVTGNGDVYIAGYFQGTFDFDPDLSGAFYLTSGGLFDIFISKFDALGNFIWAKRIGGTIYDAAFAIAIDPGGSGDVYTTGSFEETVDFNPGAGTFFLTSAGTDNIFISKLDSSGNFIWAKAMTGTGFINSGNSIAIDPKGSGDVYTTGRFEETVDFDPDSSGQFNLTSGGLGDIFISKLDSAGNFIWAKSMGASSNDFGYSIAIDPAGSGDAYVAGLFQETVDFDPDSSGTFNLTSAGVADAFISKLNSSGNFIWAKAIGGSGDDQSYSIALDPTGSGDAYITGFFYSPSLTFDFSSLTNAGGGPDIFIARLGVLTGIESVENNNNGISVFPNPAPDHFTIAFGGSNKKVKVIITDITGKLIYTTTETETQKIEVNLTQCGVTSGVYIVRIQTSDSIVMKELIIAQ